jgi:putative ABC transport system permease protein
MLLTTILLSLREISRHKLRSFLTVLGVVIGVASVVTMVTLGTAAGQSIQTQIASLGSNLLTVVQGGGFGRGGGGAPPPPFKPEDVEAIRTQIAGVIATAPQVQTSVTAVRNSANWSVNVNGTTGDFLKGHQWTVVDGRPFSQNEEEAGKSVCLIGNTVRTNLYHSEEPVGTRIRLGNISCEVIGALPELGGIGQDQDNVVLMPYKAVQRRLTGNRNIQMIMVAADPHYDSKAIQDAITALLRERRHIGPDKDDDFTIFDTKQLSDSAASVFGVITGVVTAIAAISLLVGGIGIMNIMLVSVTERTREIGIRLAIGAVAREVLLQFLVEAAVLSSLGGLIGLLIALGASAGLAMLMHMPFLWLPRINLIAFGISALIGVVFGYFPARRAASLNPIDALRHE